MSVKYGDLANTEHTERVHRKYYKWLLNVKPNTNKLSIYAECGRCPVILQYKIVKYFLKLNSENFNNCILKTIYVNMHEESNHIVSIGY